MALLFDEVLLVVSGVVDELPVDGLLFDVPEDGDGLSVEELLLVVILLVFAAVVLDCALTSFGTDRLRSSAMMPTTKIASVARLAPYVMRRIDA